MIKLLATGLAMAASVAGVALLAMWLRSKLTQLRLGGIDPRCLEVLARVGLHTNQGLAVVRVGRRFLLVSSGEGGARMITELSEDDLAQVGEEAPPLVATSVAEPAALSFPVRLHQAMSFVSKGRANVLLAWLLAASMSVSFVGAAGELQAQVRAPVSPDVLAPNETFPSTALQQQRRGSVFDALPPVALQVGDEEEGLRLSGTVGTVVILGLLSLAPTLLLLTTSFTRILIVLHLLRQALGTQNTPPSHLLAGLAILLSGAVMAPTIQEIRVVAVDPWMAGEIDEGTALSRATEPMRIWMFSHTREPDLRTFLEISRTPPPLSPADVPNTVLMSAFVTSELRTAFEIGFAIFLPFIVIDLVVAAVLTSMGMFMLPPTMIALPCKLMLFVLMDGWTLLLGSLAQSFL